MNTVPAVPTSTGNPDRPSRRPKVARDTRDIPKEWRHDRIGGQAGRTHEHGPRS